MISVTQMNVSISDIPSDERNIRVVINDGNTSGTCSGDSEFTNIELESIVTIYVGGIIVATMYLRDCEIANAVNEIGIEIWHDGIIQRSDRSFTI